VGTRTTFDLINQQHTKRFVVGARDGPGGGTDAEEGHGHASSHAAVRDSILAVFEVTGNYAR
jgi:hypothetical protein